MEKTINEPVKFKECREKIKDNTSCKSCKNRNDCIEEIRTEIANNVGLYFDVAQNRRAILYDLNLLISTLTTG